MGKKEKDTSVTKSPRTIEIKVVIPWLIVAVLGASVAGLIGGWTIHAQAMSEAGQVVAHLKGL